jgi:hypothetical protein
MNCSECNQKLRSEEFHYEHPETYVLGLCVECRYTFSEMNRHE